MGPYAGHDDCAARCVELFRRHLDDHPDLVVAARRELRGRDLMCWCPLDQPCHADVLLEIANAPEEDASDAMPKRTVALVDEQILRPVYRNSKRLPCPYCGAENDCERLLPTGWVCDYDRACRECGKQFRVRLDWTPEYTTERIDEEADDADTQR